MAHWLHLQLLCRFSTPLKADFFETFFDNVSESNEDLLASACIDGSVLEFHTTLQHPLTLLKVIKTLWNNPEVEDILVVDQDRCLGELRCFGAFGAREFSFKGVCHGPEELLAYSNNFAGCRLVTVSKKKAGVTEVLEAEFRNVVNELRNALYQGLLEEDSVSLLGVKRYLEAHPNFRL